MIRSFHLLGNPGVGAGKAQRTKGQGRKTQRKAVQRFAATPVGTGLPSHPRLQGVLEGARMVPPTGQGLPAAEGEHSPSCSLGQGQKGGQWHSCPGALGYPRPREG